MKKMILWIMMAVLTASSGTAQSFEAQQLLLNVEKLAQLKQILDNMYKGYKVLQEGYTAIKDISEGNFNIHKVFLDKLLAVSPLVRNYKRVADIVQFQLRIVQEYKAAYGRFRKNTNFTESEISYIGRVYNNLFNTSLKKLDELLMIITAGRLRMTDDERLAAVDRIYEDMVEQLSFLRHFNSSTAMLGMQRAGELHDVDVLRKIYGIK